MPAGRYRKTAAALIMCLMMGISACAPDTSGDKYGIRVLDVDKQPVAGVTVQFCTDETCELGRTDESGLAVFDYPPGVYEVHILKVPEGYREDPEVYKTEDTPGEMKITVEKE